MGLIGCAAPLSFITPLCAFRRLRRQTLSGWRIFPHTSASSLPIPPWPRAFSPAAVWRGRGVAMRNEQ